MTSGRYCSILSLRFTARVIGPEVTCGEVADVTLDQRPDAFLRVQVWRVGGQLEDREPVRVRFDERPQGLGQVEADVVPDQDDRAAELDAGADQQFAPVASAEALGLVLVFGVLADGVEEPGPLARLVAGHACHRYTARTPAAHADNWDAAPAAPGPGSRRRQRLTGLVLEDDPAVTGRRDALTRGQTSFFHRSTAASSRSIARRAGCHDQPCRFSSRRVPSTVYDTWNSRPISVFTRAKGCCARR